jgi:hypothetical protein
MNLFYNREEKRVRSFWRIVIQTIFYLFGTVLAGVLISVVQMAVLAAQGDLSLEQLTNPQAMTNLIMNSGGGIFFALSGIASVIVMVLSFLFAGWALDKRTFKNFGFHFSKQWAFDLGFGLLLGAVLMVFIFLVELAFGWVTVTGYFQASSAGNPIALVLFLSLIHFISVGIYEEMLSRGYHLRNLAEGLNFKAVGPKISLLLAYFISSSIFGLLHLGNPNSSLVSTLNIILAGLFLGLGFVLTGELALPIGLHITWNFFQGNVFGFPVSGTNAGGSMVQIQQLGPQWMTGGAFGPEAGLIGILAILIGCALIVLYVKQTRGTLRWWTELSVYEPKTPRNAETDIYPQEATPPAGPQQDSL